MFKRKSYFHLIKLDYIILKIVEREHPPYRIVISEFADLNSESERQLTNDLGAPSLPTPRCH